MLHGEHYKDECYHTQSLSAKLKAENSPNGRQTSKGNGANSYGKSKGDGKGEQQGKGGPGGTDKRNRRNKDKSGGKTNLTPRGTNSEPSGGDTTLGVRLVPKHKLKINKNKESNVPKKSKTSLVPASSPT